MNWRGCGSDNGLTEGTVLALIDRTE